MRAFLAVGLPADVRGTLSGIAVGLGRDWPARTTWVSSGQLHLTLRFLGEINTRQEDAIRTELGPALTSEAPFSFDLTQLGAFPAPSRPSVVWAGVAFSASLMRIHAMIEKCLSNLGFKPDDKPFFPHLTLGRVKDRIRVSDGAAILARHDGAVSGTVVVDAVILYESRLTPQGPVYTERARFPLAGSAG